MTKRRILAASLLTGFFTVPAFADEVVTTYYYTPSLAEIYAPAPEPVLVEERITVIAPSLTEDQAITRDVVDTLAYDSRLSGRIGVETRNNTVELSGRVATPGQVRIAERDAKSVPGVREVRNSIRPSVGGSY